MDRHGNLGIERRSVTIFVFEELIAHLERPSFEKWALKGHKWAVALDCWEFDTDVCNWMYELMHRHNAVLDVMTWHPQGFADLVHERLWDIDIPVLSAKSAVFESVSPRLAIDDEVICVFDADPDHRFSYGFKSRELQLGRL